MSPTVGYRVSLHTVPGREYLVQSMPAAAWHHGKSRATLVLAVVGVCRAYDVGQIAQPAAF